MKRAFMVEFELPETMTEEFMALIPRHRYVINQMLVEGVVQGYSLALDRSRVWAVMVADSEEALMNEIDRMPLVDFMRPYVSELMFHNSASSVLQFSLN
jgi:muconolactone delta-isomerase